MECMELMGSVVEVGLIEHAVLVVLRNGFPAGGTELPALGCQPAQVGFCGYLLG